MAPIRFREMILWHTCIGNIIQETANAGCGHGSAHPLLRGLQSSTAHALQTTGICRGDSFRTFLRSRSVVLKSESLGDFLVLSFSLLPDQPIRLPTGRSHPAQICLLEMRGWMSMSL